MGELCSQQTQPASSQDPAKLTAHLQRILSSFRCSSLLFYGWPANKSHQRVDWPGISSRLVSSASAQPQQVLSLWSLAWRAASHPLPVCLVN